MALTKNKPVETPAVSIEEKKEFIPEDSKIIEEKKPAKRRESDKMIILEHPVVKGSANVGMYFKDEEISFDIKEGKYSFDNKQENYALRDALLKDGWIDHTYYGHFHNESVSIPSQKQIIQWTYKHPLATPNYPMEGSVAVNVQGEEFTLELKDSVIILKESEIKNARFIAEKLEKDGFHLIDFVKEK